MPDQPLTTVPTVNPVGQPKIQPAPPAPSGSSGHVREKQDSPHTERDIMRDEASSQRGPS
jgi:hypothetical protein